MSNLSPETSAVFFKDVSFTGCYFYPFWIQEAYSVQDFSSLYFSMNLQVGFDSLENFFSTVVSEDNSDSFLNRKLSNWY